MAVNPGKKENPIVSSPKRRGRKPLKDKKEKLFQKKGFGHTNNSVQVVCHNSGKCKSYKRKRATNGDIYDNVEAMSSAITRANEVQAKLAPEFPSVVKCMLPSNVTGGFWLSLPKKFCDSHLPKHDALIVLEDESGEEYKTRYLAVKNGLSAGWRGFSMAHNLMDRDVLVFHLVMPSKFKVYIVRPNGSDEVDGALALLKLDTCTQQIDYEKDNTSYRKIEGKCGEPLLADIPDKNAQNNTLMTHTTNLGHVSNQSENESEELGSEVLDGIRLSESVVNFKEVKNINNFNITVNGLIINSELSQHLLTKYYELCCSQSSFLHDHLLEGLNCKLAGGVIAETINIADAIRASKLTTSPNNFAVWDKTLKAFEDIGMNVGFLRARLNQMRSLAVKSKRYKEARADRVHAEEEIRALGVKTLEVKEVINRLDAEIETLEVNAVEPELMFQKVANAPW